MSRQLDSRQITATARRLAERIGVRGLDELRNVLESANGIQALTVGLSGKIWQKIMILESRRRVIPHTNPIDDRRLHQPPIRIDTATSA